MSTRDDVLQALRESAAPLSGEQLARRLGISRSYVSRIEKRALQKLREAMEGFS